MNLERAVMAFAGSMILISLLLAHWISPYWLWLTAFVGANLLQASVTRWCLVAKVMNKLGIRGGGRVFN